MGNPGEKRRLNVALFINAVYNDYSTLVCRGAAAAAEDLDVNLLFVPGREIKAQWSEAALNRFEYQHNMLFSYLTENNIDVIIMSLGTFAIFLNDQEIQDFLKLYSGIKVVIMEMIIPGYPCVLFGFDGLRAEIEHIVKDHGKRKVAFLAGQKGQSVSEARLAVYRQVLEENGIPYNESYVEYGDFSEWCVEKAGNLLDRNRDNLPEAICCANDSMVRALGKAMEERNLKIGVDILVTGYDDAVFAGVMDPPLTTVKSYIITMGFEAVKLAVKYWHDGENEIRYVKTALLKRASCGCKMDNDDNFDRELLNTELPKEKFSENLLEYICERSSLEIIPKFASERINDFTGYVYDCIKDDEIKYSIRTLNEKLDEIFNCDVMEFFSISSFRTLFVVIRQVLLEKMNSESKRTAVHELYGDVYHKFSSYLASSSIEQEERRWLDQFLFARITDEMMDTGKDEEQCFQSLIMILSKLDEKFKSCYLYIFNEHVFNPDIFTDSRNEKWKRPDNIYLRAFYDRNGITIPDREQRKMGSEYFMLNPFVDLTERRTFVLETVYFNDEQYGIMMIESESRNFVHIYGLAKQLSTAIKMTRFTNQLESALNEVNEKNDILSRESVSDQLTSLYNRRGFMTESEKILKARSSEGFKGGLMFADLDSLKIINDTFGHKNGDFAIRKAASLLTDNLSSGDVTGRIGGDEFVAFVPDADEERMNEICASIRRTADEFNAGSDKPYNVSVSMGFYCFDSADGETLEQLMMNADRVLYENKKKKKKTPIKDN